MYEYSKATSEKILKELAAVSTPEHAEQVVKRNSESLAHTVSYTPCPHCIGGFDCRNCLWMYAINKVTKEGKHTILARRCCPCMLVEFDGNFLGLSLWPDRLEEKGRTIDNKIWRQAHIAWASNAALWGTRPAPKGYRTEVNS